MRVSHVITRLIVGGAQENTISTVLGLQNRQDLSVDLITGPSLGSEGSMESQFDHYPGKLITVPELVRPVHPIKDAMAYTRLKKLFREFRPDIVHTHSGKAGILGRLAAHRAGVPIIIHTIHGPSFGPFQGRIANTLFRSAEHYAAKVTIHFVSVADAMTRQYLEAGIGSPKQYSRIYSGFDLDPFLTARNNAHLRNKYGISQTDFVVGTIARLFKLKGHDDLISIAPELSRKFPSLKFLLVGDGPWRERLQSRIQSAGLQDRFVFTGLVPPADVPGLVGIMDALVHLSLREGLPRALPQAMAAGKPVMAYDCDGAREVCIDGTTGFLVSPGNLEQLKNQLSVLMNNPDLCSQFGTSGQQFVRTRFPVERMVSDIHDLYMRLAAEKRKSL